MTGKPHRHVQCSLRFPLPRETVIPRYQGVRVSRVSKPLGPLVSWYPGHDPVRVLILPYILHFGSLALRSAILYALFYISVRCRRASVFGFWSLMADTEIRTLHAMLCYATRAALALALMTGKWELGASVGAAAVIEALALAFGGQAS